MMTSFKYGCLWILLLWPLIGFGQKAFDANYDGIAAVVQMDSFVISAKETGFDVLAFIDLVQEDRSFEQAFQNLRLFGFKADHQMRFYNKKGKKIAEYTAETQQEVQDSCRWMEFLREPESAGFFFKRNENYRYFTARMYDKVFFTHHKTCITNSNEPTDAKGLQKYYQELKTFIFQPGERVEIPIVANKTAIFSEDLMPYYDYSITQEPYLNQKDCWAFTIQVKEDYTEKKKGKTLIKYLKTYFDPNTFQVLGRNYEIANEGLASCSVRMSVELTHFNGHYLPKKISYNGTWNIPGKPRETGDFTARFYAYE